MDYSKKKAPLLKRRERILELIQPYNMELEFIDAQLNLINEYEKAQKENEPELSEIPPFIAGMKV